MAAMDDSPEAKVPDDVPDKVPLSESETEKARANTPGYDAAGKLIHRGQPGYVRHKRPRNPNAHLEKAWRREMGIRRKCIPTLLPDKDGILRPIQLVERNAISNLSRGQSLKEAARNAGMTIAKAEELLLKGEVQEYLRNRLHYSGITDELLFKRMREGLDATTQREFLVKGEGGGEIITGADKPDLDQRRNYMKDALQLKGYLTRPDDLAGDKGGITFNLFQTLIQARKDRGLDVPADIVDVKTENVPDDVPDKVPDNVKKEEPKP